MDSVKSFLNSHSSASVSLISSRLEIPIKALYGLLESALHELGIQNYRIIYSIYSGNQVTLCTEKNKKEAEEKLGTRARIYAVQRVTEDLNNLYNLELEQRLDLISTENKNGGIYLPIYSNIGAYGQERREYSSQKKLNFRARKIELEKIAEDKKLVQKAIIRESPPEQPVFELEEENSVRIPVPNKISFNKIVDLNVDDMADIISNELNVQSATKDPKVVFDVEDGVEEVKENKETNQTRAVKKTSGYTPKIFIESKPLPVKRQITDSIIPNSSSTRKISKMTQPSLSSFIKKN